MPHVHAICMTMHDKLLSAFNDLGVICVQIFLYSQSTPSRRNIGALMAHSFGDLDVLAVWPKSGLCQMTLVRFHDEPKAIAFNVYRCQACGHESGCRSQLGFLYETVAVVVPSEWMLDSACYDCYNCAFVNVSAPLKRLIVVGLSSRAIAILEE